MGSPSLLLHVCCAPCSVACVESLAQEGFSPTAFWYNPNIHPFTEYRNRMEAMEAYARQIGMPLILHGKYGLRPFIQAVTPNIDSRCETCYRTRMEATARYAARNGFECFTSTLLISPYQNHDLLCQVAREEGEKAGVHFLYRDFRPLFRQGQTQARALGLYMQKYCGCIFSEEERYQKPSAGGKT
ncbi:MAG: epoxyqueuosine reductase QueH [Clostridiales bacterium]|nr:epoxyqueuosine reductase QueH [Clostridiales bacterium]